MGDIMFGGYDVGVGSQKRTDLGGRMAHSLEKSGPAQASLFLPVLMPMLQEKETKED
jgi:hypothetical protein